MLLRQSLLLVLLGCQIILPLKSVVAQNSVERVITDRIKCSIAVKDSSWSRQEPAYVEVRMENISANDISFRARYSFVLKRKGAASARDFSTVGNSYWSPAGIVNKGGQLLLVPHTPRKSTPRARGPYQFPNEVILLLKGESRLITIDLSRFPWNDSVLSGWPAGNLFDSVPKGNYWLELSITANDERVVSNKLEVQIE